MNLIQFLGSRDMTFITNCEGFYNVPVVWLRTTVTSIRTESDVTSNICGPKKIMQNYKNVMKICTNVTLVTCTVIQTFVRTPSDYPGRNQHGIKGWHNARAS